MGVRTDKELARQDIMKELADVAIYADLIISVLGGVPAEVITEKFQGTSDKFNYPRIVQFYTGHILLAGLIHPIISLIEEESEVGNVDVKILFQDEPTSRGYFTTAIIVPEVS